MLQPTERTAMLLKITKLSSVLPSFDSEEAAVASFVSSRCSQTVGERRRDLLVLLFR